MVIDERRDHSFRIPRPDLSVALGTTNACNNCHTRADETFQWAADAVKKWYGDRKSTEAVHWGIAFKAGRAETAEGESLLLGLLAHNTTPAVVRATAIDLLCELSFACECRSAACGDERPGYTRAAHRGAWIARR